MLIRQRKLGERGQPRVDHLGVGLSSRHQFTAEISKRDIRLPRYEVVSERYDRLLFVLEAHLGTSDHNRNIRSDLLEKRDHLSRFDNVPDVDSEPYNRRLLLKEALYDLPSRLRRLVLNDGGTGLKLREIGVEVTQSNRSVDELGV